MKKTRKIIISLVVALIIVLVVSYIFSYKDSNDFLNVPVFKTNLLENTNVTNNDIKYIKVKKDSLSNDFISQIVDINSISLNTLNRNVYEGEFVLEYVFKYSINEIDDTYEYVSIPISGDSIAVLKNTQFGDKVDVVYTAKLKDVSYAIKDKPRIYSNNKEEGYVTCILFENVDVYSKVDQAGNDNGNVITNIIIKLSKEDAMLVSNLKGLGRMDILTK